MAHLTTTRPHDPRRHPMTPATPRHAAAPRGGTR